MYQARNCFLNFSLLCRYLRMPVGHKVYLFVLRRGSSGRRVFRSDEDNDAYDSEHRYLPGNLN